MLFFPVLQPFLSSYTTYVPILKLYIVESQLQLHVLCYLPQDGRLRKGDQLLAVDNQAVVGLSHAEVGIEQVV